MANTKVPIELSSTPGIVDNSTATAITIDGTGAATFATTTTLTNGDLYVNKIGGNSTIYTNTDTSVNGSGINSTILGQSWLYGANWGASDGRFVIYDSTVGAERFSIAPTTGAATFSGNVGIGVTPSAWNSFRVMQFPYGGAIAGYNGSAVPILQLSSNTYHVSGVGDKYFMSAAAAKYQLNQGQHQWSTAPSGTADADQSFTTNMTLDASGNLLVGTTSNPSARDMILSGMFELNDGTPASRIILRWACDAEGFSVASAASIFGKNSATNRSINAGGTVNASGADYAEYERNGGLSIAKGDIVGFKADGVLTLTFSDAVRFAVKSTDPSYVGGDTWGTEDRVGAKPSQPERKADVTETIGEGKDAVTTVTEAGDTEAEWAAKEAQYAADLATFQEALEAARQLVDRIAYSGKVPVNIQGATAGDYIIAVAAEDGSIDGQAVSDPDFSQYKLSVGRVNRILDDGRAEVAVIIH